MFTPHSMSHVMCHVSRVICHMSCIMCHVSRFTCHMSHVIFFLGGGQSGEGYWRKVCYQRGLPPSSFIIYVTLHCPLFSFFVIGFCPFLGIFPTIGFVTELVFSNSIESSNIYCAVRTHQCSNMDTVVDGKDDIQKSLDRRRRRSGARREEGQVAELHRSCTAQLPSSFLAYLTDPV